MIFFLDSMVSASVLLSRNEGEASLFCHLKDKAVVNKDQLPQDKYRVYFLSS